MAHDAGPYQRRELICTQPISVTTPDLPALGSEWTWQVRDDGTIWYRHETGSGVVWRADAFKVTDRNGKTVDPETLKPRGKGTGHV